MKKSVSARVQSVASISYSWLYWVAIPTFLAIITFCFYAPSFHYGFQFDDIANITKHFNIRHYTFGDLFFSGPRWLSYWLNTKHYAIGKFDPYSYRVFNVCLHIANGVLIFFILMLGLTRRQVNDFFKQHAGLIATMSALLFLLHPVQTQTVSYVIQGQLEGLAAFFILSMTLTFMGFCYVQHALVKVGLFVFLWVLTVFSCCTKEIAIISPLLLLLVDWFFVAQGVRESVKKRLWLHSVIACTVVGVYLYFLKPAFFGEIFTFKRVVYNNSGNVITYNPAALITPGDYFISQFKVILHYLWIFIWPFALSVEYDWMLSRGFFAPDCLFPFLLLCGLALWAVCLVRRKPSSMAAFGMFWFFICIAPRSSILPSPELLVDYKTYLASLGWLFMLAAALVWLGQFVAKHSTRVHTAYAGQFVALSLVVPLGLGTMQRNTVWRSGLEFWGNIIQNAPGKARAYNNYGVELSQTHRKFEESIPYFIKAIQMDPWYSDPCNNLAVAYANTNQTALAIDAINRGLKINPHYPEGYNNLGSFFLKEHQYEKAQAALYKALQLRPYYGKAHYNLGRLYFEQGKHELAWQHFRDACMKGDLDNDMGFSAFAKLSLILKKYDDAIFSYTKILECLPNDPEALFNLGNAYFFAQRHDDAVRTYEHLLKINAGDLRVWYNLGETYFAQGQAKKALVCFEKIACNPYDFPSYRTRVAQCHEKLLRC